jgi:hypothetical protein
MHGTYSEKTGKALLGAVAQLADLAAGTAVDIGRHSLAQRYYIQALNLAMSAGDRLYAANVLVRMSSSHRPTWTGCGRRSAAAPRPASPRPGTCRAYRR